MSYIFIVQHFFTKRNKNLINLTLKLQILHLVYKVYKYIDFEQKKYKMYINIANEKK